MDLFNRKKIEELEWKVRELRLLINCPKPIVGSERDGRIVVFVELKRDGYTEMCYWKATLYNTQKQNTVYEHIY